MTIIVGDPEASIAAVNAAKAAIDSIQGKSVTVEVDLHRKPGETLDAYLGRLMFWRDVMARKSLACSGELAQRYADSAELIQRYVDRLRYAGDAA